jgi:hypothetical protein
MNDFRKVKEIKGLSGCVLLQAAQETLRKSAFSGWELTNLYGGDRVS